MEGTEYPPSPPTGGYGGRSWVLGAGYWFLCELPNKQMRLESKEQNNKQKTLRISILLKY